MKANGMDIKKAVEALVRPPSAPPPAPEPPKPVEPKGRTLGSIHVALEAQRIYNPSIPSVPKPALAPSKPEDQGTAPGLGPAAGWGKPS